MPPSLALASKRLLLRSLPLLLLPALLFIANLTVSTTLAGPRPESVLLAQADEVNETPEERAARLEKLREERKAVIEAQRNAKSAEAVAKYKLMSDAYLSNDMDTVQEMSKDMRRQTRMLSREQAAAVRHMIEMAPDYRPKWWKGTKKQEKNSFEAEIWGRKFWANYVPSRELGVQMVFPETEFNQRTGEWEVVDLIILVTWKPLMVDSPEAAQGRLAVEHGYTLGDIAEIIVWHELGHNYITEQIPTKSNIELYQNYSDLYSTMHEYFADMSAIYHCTPRARRMVLQFRLGGLDYYTQDSSHDRGAHGIGAIVLSDMLENPDAWPSVHFPPSVPEKQIELNTIIYVYENLSKDWTVEEDIRLQELAKEYIMKQGESTFKKKGEIKLPNGLKYKLMITDDRDNQKKRDNWVNGKLDELIQNGRADKLKEGETYAPPNRSKDRRRDFEFHGFDKDGKLIEDKNAPPRIEIPWDH